MVSKQDQGGFSQFIDIKQTLANFLYFNKTIDILIILLIIIIIIPHERSLHLFNLNLLTLKSLIQLAKKAKHGRKRRNTEEKLKVLIFKHLCIRQGLLPAGWQETFRSAAS